MSNQKLDVAWVKEFTNNEEAKEAFVSSVFSSAKVLTKLSQIIGEYMETLEDNERSTSDFSDPNWAYKQAFRNGQMAAFKRVLNVMRPFSNQS